MITMKRQILGIPLAIVVGLVVLGLAVAGSYALNGSPDHGPDSSKVADDPAVAARVSAALDAMMQPAALDSGSETLGGLSSNPYDYTIDNPQFDTLVSIGYDALPALEAELNSSANSGLREYMICIAIEKITGCDLKQFGDSQWDTARAFRDKWPVYLRSMPGRVKDILASKASAGEKDRQIAQLGAPAIPFVIDNISLVDEADDAEMAATLAGAMGGSARADTVGEFATRNASEIRKLRSYVRSYVGGR